MSYDSLIAWIVISIIAVALPGPDFVYITSVSLKRRSYGIFGGIGIQLGISWHLLLTYLGAIAFFTRYPIVFRGIQLLGALFLIYLALNILRGALRELKHLRNLKNNGESADLTMYNLSKQELVSNFDCFKKGALVNLLNPKAFIFIVSTLPQFLHAQGSFSLGEQFLVLSVTHIIVGLMWWICLALMVNYLANRFATPSFRAKLEIVSGIIILALALVLLSRIFVVLYTGDTSLV
ncbi:LysE family translocator [Psittacicella gerlachiana]|uniref:Threonine/homoserine/homoserine lactone efflux protein n=1 Tax=Psittacicella gerlachiana TaxID=2028574 RepID=A0A3A1YAB3_9GAMM|nr:LysE family translocator [Psittacicella gerlachiana]RIY33094.1 hypothetical protein CKF59_06580 [Psittacicella gerlachiana]